MKNFSVLIQNNLSEINIAIQKFEEFCIVNDISESIRQKIQVVFDEMLNNVISYGYPEKNKEEIKIDGIIEEEKIVIKIIDNGIPFDPWNLSSPDTSSGVEDRVIGGLGIHLVRNLMDEVSYRHENNHNIVSVIKYLSK